MRDVFLFAPPVEISPKFTAVICLDGDDRETEVCCRPLDCEGGILAFASREYLRITLLREGIENGELVLPLPMGVDVLHVKLDAFAGTSNHEGFLERRMPAELPLRSADEAAPLVEAIDDRG